MEEKTHYFLYARKSSEGADRQILSIEGQLAELQKIVTRDNLIIVGTYTESKSAHIPDKRPVFTEMVRRIRKGQANGLIVWHVNRITRNPKETGEIQQMLQDGKIVSIITPYRHFKSEDNALLFSIESSEANQYSRDLSVNVKRGLRQKYDLGHPPGYAQLGYLNTKSNIRGSNKIIVDPDRWHIVRKGFDLILSRAYTVSQALAVLSNEYGLRTRPGNVRGGRPLSKAGFYRMLTNPFYYGYFYCKGILYKGSYPPLITVQEFDQIQMILGRNGKPRTKKHLFPYTGLISCAVCGSAITASEKQKLIKSTGTLKSYRLYHCTHRKKGAEVCTQRSFISESIVEQQVVEELKKYQIKPSFKEWALTVARENYQTEIEKYQKLVDGQASYEKRLHQELNNLVDLRISDGITEEMYLSKKAEKDEQLIRARAQKEHLAQLSCDWIKNIEDQFNFAVNIVERFKNSDPIIKKEICHDFGWNWTLKDKKLFISKHEWLEPYKKYKDGVEDVLGRFEPENILTNKVQNPLLDLIRPLVCALVNDVRTRLRDSNNSIRKSHYKQQSSL